MSVTTQNLGPIGSAVLSLLDTHKQTNKQTNKQTDKPNLYAEAIKRNYVLKQTSLLSTKYLCNNPDRLKIGKNSALQVYCRKKLA